MLDADNHGDHHEYRNTGILRFEKQAYTLQGLDISIIITYSDHASFNPYLPDRTRISG